MQKVKEATVKAMIVLVPTYTAAYLTEKMVWVVPTLAAAGFFAGTVSFQSSTERRLEEDSEDFDEFEDVIESGVDEDGGDG